jgi:hypothetical protein
VNAARSGYHSGLRALPKTRHDGLPAISPSCRSY